MIFRENRFITLLVVIGLVCAVWTLTLRHSSESRNRVVEISVDYAEAVVASAAYGKTPVEGLRAFKDAGAVSVSVQEQTVADLLNANVIQTVEIGAGGVVFEEKTVGVLQPLVNMGLAERISQNRVKVAGGVEYAVLLPVGLPSAAVENARAVGMPIVARLVNYPGVNSNHLDAKAALLEKEGVGAVIFAADQVLGFRGGLDEVADVLKRHGILFGFVEFAKQKGDQKLAERMVPYVLNVHSITAAEMGTLSRNEAVERFVKAARERNVRLLYVRMFDLADPDAVGVNQSYIREIKSELAEKGLTVGRAHTFENVPSPTAARIMIGIGVAAGLMLLLVSVVRISGISYYAILLALTAFFAAICAVESEFALKVSALTATLVFPTLALLTAAAGSPETPDARSVRAYIWRSLGRFAAAVCITTVGGLMTAGLLSRLPFMLRVDQFAGVKLAHVLPILAAGLLFAGGVGWGSDVWNNQRERIISNLRRIMTQPVLIGYAVVGLVMLVMIGIMVARSGNDSGVEVSGLELRFRALLDTLLFVRPRTKEFLLGHPALFAGIALAMSGRRGWAALLLVIGMIGEVSILNTFCHIHTPIMLSVWRVIIGALAGAVIGVLLVLIFSRRSGRPSPEVSR